MLSPGLIVLSSGDVIKLSFSQYQLAVVSQHVRIMCVQYHNSHTQCNISINQIGSLARAVY